MGLMDTINEFIVLCLYIGYGAYVACGVLSVSIGIYYITQVDSNVESAAAKITFSVGLFMIIAGGTALLSLHKKNWMLMFVIELINIALFVLMLMGGFIALCLALEIRKPVLRSVQETWKLPGVGRNEHEFADFCKTKVGTTCSDWYVKTAEIKLRIDTIIDNGGLGGLKCAALSPKVCDATVINCRRAISAWVDRPPVGDSWNCSNPAVGSADCVVVVQKTNGADKRFRKDYDVSDLEVACNTCDKDCMYKVAADIESHLKPAAIGAFVTLFVLVITIAVNNSIVHLATMDGLHPEGVHGASAKLGFVCNGVLFAFSTLLIAAGSYGMWKVSKLCAEAEHLHEDCTSWAAVGLVTLGVALMLLSTFVMLGIHKSNNILAIDLIRLCQLLYIATAFGVLLCTVAFAVSSGLIDSINTHYATAGPKIVKDLKIVNPAFCTACRGTQCKEMTEQACLNKGEKYIRTQTEGNLKTVGYVALVVVVFMAVVIYFTERAVKLFHLGDFTDEIGIDDSSFGADRSGSAGDEV